MRYCVNCGELLTGKSRKVEMHMIIGRGGRDRLYRYCHDRGNALWDNGKMVMTGPVAEIEGFQERLI